MCLWKIWSLNLFRFSYLFWGVQYSLRYKLTKILHNFLRIIDVLRPLHTSLMVCLQIVHMHVVYSKALFLPFAFDSSHASSKDSMGCIYYVHYTFAKVSIKHGKGRKDVASKYICRQWCQPPILRRPKKMEFSTIERSISSSSSSQPTSIPCDNMTVLRLVDVAIHLHLYHLRSHSL